MTSNPKPMIFLTMVPQETRAIGLYRRHSKTFAIGFFWIWESNVELSNFRVLTRFDEARAFLFPMSPNVRCETRRLKVEFWQVFKTSQNRHEMTRIRGVPKAPNKFLSTHAPFSWFLKKISWQKHRRHKRKSNRDKKVGLEDNLKNHMAFTTNAYEYPKFC